MRLRIVDCGLRIDNGRSSRGWTPTALIRNPQSAIRNWFCCFLAACTPVTTRPDFLPDPRAARLVLDAPRPERDLEVVVPKTHAGHTIADSLVAALKKRFGTPNSAPTAP